MKRTDSPSLRVQGELRGLKFATIPEPKERPQNNAIQMNGLPAHRHITLTESQEQAIRDGIRKVADAHTALTEALRALESLGPIPADMDLPQNACRILRLYGRA